MPYGLPAAAVVVTTCDAFTEDERKTFVPYQSHAEILRPCADQDGWDGEIWCRVDGKELAIARHNLRLPTS